MKIDLRDRTYQRMLLQKCQSHSLTWLIYLRLFKCVEIVLSLDYAFLEMILAIRWCS